MSRLILKKNNFEIESDDCQRGWISTALEYLPDEVRSDKKFNVVIIALGQTGACRLSRQYVRFEHIFLSDWIFPPLGASEEEQPGQFFISTVLHEIAHARCQHKSYKFDDLTAEQDCAQEEEADTLALKWFNQHVSLSDKEYLKKLEFRELRALVDQYSTIFSKFLEARDGWHKETPS